MDEENDRTETRPTKEALREGDTLRAKFFRWKDRVVGDVGSNAFLNRPAGSSPLIPTNPGISAKAMEALHAIIASPDDRRAYEEAVSSFREMAAALKAGGLPVNPEAEEE